jgi:hypothetical protein
MIDNNDGFLRSMDNPGAVVNIKDDNLIAYKKHRKQMNELHYSIGKINNLEKEVNSLKGDLTEIKELLVKVLNK